MIEHKKIKKHRVKAEFWLITFLLGSVFNSSLQAQASLETEVFVTDQVMYFDGNKVELSHSSNNAAGYDYVYGRALTPHGDCVKSYGDYVFLTWYKGGENNRQVMLTRYNKVTGVKKTIEFPHQHTGYNGKWWIGETHNTIAVGICPKDGTIHMVYDMHRNGTVAAFANDYLRYSYSVEDAATVPDEDFDIDLFVQSPNNNYKHLSFPGITDTNTTKLLTYPAFFTNDEGDLFMKNRFGYSENGRFLFAKYDGNDWEGYTDFNRSNASGFGSEYNWGLYGDIKYLNGKIRIGFQRRSNNRNDKYKYQNGFYYAYSDDQSGLTQWKDFEGTGFTRPLAIADKILISEPGDLVETTLKDQVYMVSGFDWTVTENEDVHFIGKVRDDENGITKYVHTYKTAGASDFTTSTDFTGADALYSSGENVYIIGLNSSGRPRVQEAQGGTNVFTTIYEATSGKRFEKGQVFIEGGKLYYYLLENHSTDKDDTRPVYLQIIDLGIDDGPQPFAVSLLAPIANASYEEGKEIDLVAKATTDVGSITKVEFYANNVLIGSANTKPYSIKWTPQSIETFSLKAKVYNDVDNSIESSGISIEITEIDHSDLTGDVYRLRNMSTGKFLMDVGSSATPVSMSDTGDNTNTHWTIVESGVFFNIDSETFGILRATGSTFIDGAYAVVSTGKASPAGDSDKTWTIHYNEQDDVFRFESRTNNRFLSHDVNGNVVNISVDQADAIAMKRSEWQAISTSEDVPALSIANVMNSNPIRVYPNPARNSFKISFSKKINGELVISDLLGQNIYRAPINSKEHSIMNNGLLSPGVYLISIISGDEKVYNSKLIIN